MDKEATFLQVVATVCNTLLLTFIYQLRQSFIAGQSSQLKFLILSLSMLIILTIVHKKNQIDK